MANDQQRSFEALYHRYYPDVLVFLSFLVGSQEVAEDLASLVFEKALMHFADVENIETAGPWLYRIARNCAIDYFRRRKPGISLELLSTEEHPPEASLEDLVVANDEQRYLLTQLQQLSERELVVIGLKFVANLSNRDIARVLQIPEGTVGSLLYRSLRRLRSLLTEEMEHENA
jgi:RNA polymerase sigma factor (sigma-70 family)